MLDKRFEKLARLYRRIFGAIFAALLLWIVLSLTLSVGAQLLEQTMRTHRLPKAPKIKLDSKAKAEDCYRRLRGFYKEFIKHALDVHAKIKKNPNLAYEQWNQWYQDWLKTLTEFGDHYGFRTEVNEPTEYYKRLKHKYTLLESTAKRFDAQIRSMIELLRTDFPVLKHEFKRR